jgi:hypothetical protein
MFASHAGRYSHTTLQVLRAADASADGNDRVALACLGRYADHVTRYGERAHGPAGEHLLTVASPAVREAFLTI